jgi:hypothetical protein
MPEPNCRNVRHFYEISGVIVASSEPLPEARRVDGAPDLWFELADDADPLRDPIDAPSVDSGKLGDGWPAIIRGSDGYLLCFPGAAEFQVDPEATRIRCLPRRDVPIETIRHLLLDQVIPRALSLRGGVVLHASAVVLGGDAVGFLGRTGEGKSTLATSFGAAGWVLLADDSLHIRATPSGEVYGLPSYPGMRLHPENAGVLLGKKPIGVPVAHYADKRRVGPETMLRFARERTRIRRLYILMRDDQATSIAIERPSLSDAFVELVRYAFRLDVEDVHRSRNEFRLLGLSTAPRLVRLLSYPGAYDALADVQAAVLDDLRDV